VAGETALLLHQQRSLRTRCSQAPGFPDQGGYSRCYLACSDESGPRSSLRSLPSARYSTTWSSPRSTVSSSS